MYYLSGIIKTPELTDITSEEDQYFKMTQKVEVKAYQILEKIISL
jgi:hypothetical protein